MLPSMKTPRLPIALQQAVMRSLRHHLQLANEKLEGQYDEPKLVYQQRGTAAGTAWLEKWEIRINPVLLLENQQAFVDEVVPHELAHLLVWKTFGRVPPHASVRNRFGAQQYFPRSLPLSAASAHRAPSQSRAAR